MARVEFAPEVLDDFDRILGHLARFEVADAQARVAELGQAVQILTHSKLIGRPARGGKRELAIGRDAHGYVAVYRCVASIDMVFVLAIRGQRRQGSRREG